MLVRKLKRGDCLTFGGVIIQVRKCTDDNLSLAIEAPEGMEVHHARQGVETSQAEDKAPSPLE